MEKAGQNAPLPMYPAQSQSQQLLHPLQPQLLQPQPQLLQLLPMSPLPPQEHRSSRIMMIHQQLLLLQPLLQHIDIHLVIDLAAALPPTEISYASPADLVPRGKAVKR